MTTPGKFQEVLSNFFKDKNFVNLTISYYIKSFKFDNNSSNTCERLEFNSFMGWSFAIFTFFAFILFILTVFLSITNYHNLAGLVQSPLPMLYLLLGFFGLHCIPYIKIIKRRFNTLFLAHSNLFFRIYMGFLFIYVIGAIFLIKNYILNPEIEQIFLSNPKIVLYFFCYQILATLLFALHAFLILKKLPVFH